MSLRPLILAIAAASACFAQAQQPAPATLVVGRQFVAELKLDQDADRVLFERIGFDRAAAVLTAVTNRGMEPHATAAEWAEMHRALDGLAELYVAKGELFRAALYAGFQEIYYRNDEGDYTQALAAARRALDYQQRSGQAATLDICWSSIGEDLMRLGRTAEALDAFYQAHHITQDPTSNRAARAWRFIVQGEIARADFGAARRELDAYVQQSEAPSAPPYFRGMALLARADLEAASQRYGEAIEAIHAALKAVPEDKDQSFGFECAFQLLSLGSETMRSLPYDQAMALARRIDTEFPGLPFPVSAFARQVMEHRRRIAGDYDGLLREENAVLEKARAEKNVAAQVDALTALAVTYSYANGIRQQITLLEEAMTLEKSMLPASGIPENATAQRYYFNSIERLGSAYADSKEIGKARKCFDEVLKGIDSIADAAARGRLASIYANAQLGKALVAELDDDPDTARELLKKALAAPASAKFDRSSVLLQFARLERNLNEQPLDAVRYYEEAAAVLHASKDTRWEISTRLQLARYLAVEAAKKVPDAQTRAAEQLKLAHAAAQSIEFADAEWRVLFLEGIVAENAGRADEAIDRYRASVARLDRVRAGLPQQEQRQSFMDNESVQELYRRLLALLTAGNHRADAWEYLERGKARAFLEAMQGRRFRSGTSTDNSELAAMERQIIDLRTDLSPENESALRGAGKEPAVLHAKLQELENRFVVARQQAATVSSRAAQPLSLKPISLAEVRKALPPHAALVEYAVMDGAVTAFIVTAGAADQIRWEANTKTLNANLRQLRDLMSNAASGEELPPLLKSVSDAVVAPVARALPAGIDRLLIVPTQALNYVPFQALLLPDGRALVEQFTITYLPSASTLQFLKAGHKKASGDLFLGALGNISVDGWAPLPGTLTETAGIQKIFPGATRVAEARFTHDEAVKALTTHEEVHFATHGLFDEAAPLFSALLTGPAPGEPSRVSLYELMDLKLKARLVVLSACETNRGKLMGGDEVTGLTRTILLAGAEAVVSSLWKVSDESTALLMQGFYRRLHAGQSPSSALREAALEVRKQFPHPFYWAPFVETGVE